MEYGVFAEHICENLILSADSELKGFSHDNGRFPFKPFEFGDGQLLDKVIKLGTIELYCREPKIDQGSSQT